MPVKIKEKHMCPQLITSSGAIILLKESKMLVFYIYPTIFLIIHQFTVLFKQKMLQISSVVKGLAVHSQKQIETLPHKKTRQFFRSS